MIVKKAIVDLSFPRRHAGMLDERNIYLTRVYLTKMGMELYKGDIFWKNSFRFWSQKLAAIEDLLLQFESAAS